MNPPKRDRRPKTRILRNALPELLPYSDAGYPLLDIWEAYKHEHRVEISYRHFIRTIARLRKAGALTEAKQAPQPGSWLGRVITKWKN